MISTLSSWMRRLKPEPMRWLVPVETPYRERAWDKSIVTKRRFSSPLHGEARCSTEREAMLRFLERIQPELKGVIVDVGAGRSHIKRLLPALPVGTKVIAQDAVAYEGVDVVCDATALTSRIAADSVDAVTCFEVLEHLEEPSAVIREMFAVLKPGGRLYLTIPFQYPIHGWKLSGGRLDYWRFTEHGLRRLLAPHCAEPSILYSGRRREAPVSYCVVAEKAAAGSPA